MSVILEILSSYDYVCHRLRKLGNKYRLGLVTEIILFNFYREKYDWLLQVQTTYVKIWTALWKRGKLLPHSNFEEFVSLALWTTIRLDFPFYFDTVDQTEYI